jgi:hypothetical protein
MNSFEFLERFNYLFLIGRGNPFNKQMGGEN